MEPTANDVEEVGCLQHFPVLGGGDSGDHVVQVEVEVTDGASNDLPVRSESEQHGHHEIEIRHEATSEYENIEKVYVQVGGFPGPEVQRHEGNAVCHEFKAEQVGSSDEVHAPEGYEHDEVARSSAESSCFEVVRVAQVDIHGEAGVGGQGADEK